MSKIGFVGLGRLGFPVALAIESKGHTITGYDRYLEIDKYVSGELPYPHKEEGLQPLLENTKLKVAQSIGEVVSESDIVFLPIQTPHDERYEGITRIPEERVDFDYTFLKAAIAEVASQAAKLEKPTTLAVISTCLPGTFEREIKPLLNEYIDYVYTPQFIAMGGVIDDYLSPEFNLIGVENKEAAQRIEEFYKTINDAPAVKTDITTAEGIKVSYNTWITAKTVIANSWGEIAYKTGMNFDDIYKAWSLSGKRLLSNRYMDSGVGDGGGCHPRDNIALSYLAKSINLSYDIFEALMLAREEHMAFIGNEALYFSQKFNLPVIILGRSFKPETEIETGSPSLLMASVLAEANVEFIHVEDIEPTEKAIYVLGTRHKRYNGYRFPEGSVVLDPFGFILDQEGVEVVRIGRP